MAAQVCNTDKKYYVVSERVDSVDFCPESIASDDCFRKGCETLPEAITAARTFNASRKHQTDDVCHIEDAEGNCITEDIGL